MNKRYESEDNYADTLPSGGIIVWLVFGVAAMVIVSLWYYFG
jgi:hypothetical protein